MQQLIIIAVIIIASAATTPRKHTPPPDERAKDSTVKPWINYYNLKGSLLKRSDSSYPAKRIVLTLLPDTTLVNSLVRQGKVIEVPSEELLDRLLVCDQYTKRKEKECGFVVARSGSISTTYYGSADSLPVTEKNKRYKKFEKQGTYPVYDVHTHPKQIIWKKNGDPEYTVPTASDSDKVAYNDVNYLQPCFLLGYGREEKENKYKFKDTLFISYISFYNKKNAVIASLPLDSFMQIVRKTSK